MNQKNLAPLSGNTQKTPICRQVANAKSKPSCLALITSRLSSGSIEPRCRASGPSMDSHDFSIYPKILNLPKFCPTEREAFPWKDAGNKVVLSFWVRCVFSIDPFKLFHRPSFARARAELAMPTAPELGVSSVPEERFMVGW